MLVIDPMRSDDGKEDDDSVNDKIQNKTNGKVLSAGAIKRKEYQAAKKKNNKLKKKNKTASAKVAMEITGNQSYFIRFLFLTVIFVFIDIFENKIVQ